VGGGYEDASLVLTSFEEYPVIGGRRGSVMYNMQYAVCNTKCIRYSVKSVMFKYEIDVQNNWWFGSNIF